MRRSRAVLRSAALAALALSAAGCATGSGMGAPEMMERHRAMHHFTTAVHVGEVEEAQLALTAAADPAVRAFAQRMVTEHTSALQNEMRTMRSMGMGIDVSGTVVAGFQADPATADMAALRLALLANPHARPVVEDHERAMQTLQAAGRGAAFDRAYAQRQVAAHTFALREVDRMMTDMGLSSSGPQRSRGSSGLQGGMSGPGTTMMTPAEMEAMYRTAREMIAMHLEQAQRLPGAM